MSEIQKIDSKKYQPLSGEYSLKGDKSIAIRVLVFSALLAEHPVKIYNLPLSDDVNACIDSLILLGWKISFKKEYHILYPAETIAEVDLDARNSRTALVHLIGLTVLKQKKIQLFGDKVLSSRSFCDIEEVAGRFGVELSFNDGLPVKIIEGLSTYPLEVHLNGSAQSKSLAIMLGLFSSKPIIYNVSGQSRDHTERLLEYNGWQKSQHSLTSFSLTKLNQNPWMDEYRIPADPSSAAFLMVLVAFAKNSLPITLKAVCLNKARIGFFEALKLNYSISNVRKLYNEITGDIHLEPGCGQSSINTINIECNYLIDEFPILAVAACFLKEESILLLPERLKTKESDRISTILEMLGKFKVQYEFSEYKDPNADIAKEGSEGSEGPKYLLRIKGGSAAFGNNIISPEGCSDHRILKSYIVMAILTDSTLTLNHSSCLNVSFPEFLELLGY